MDPLMKIGSQVEEVLCLHTHMDRAERRKLALEADVYKRQEKTSATSAGEGRSAASPAGDTAASTGWSKKPR